MKQKLRGCYSLVVEVRSILRARSLDLAESAVMRTAIETYRRKLAKSTQAVPYYNSDLRRSHCVNTFDGAPGKSPSYLVDIDLRLSNKATQTLS